MKKGLSAFLSLSHYVSFFKKKFREIDKGKKGNDHICISYLRIITKSRQISKTHNPDRSDRAQKAFGTDRPYRADRNDRLYRAERFHRAYRVYRPNKHYGLYRPRRPDRTYRAHRAGRLRDLIDPIR